MDPEDIKFSPINLAKVIELADSGAINSTVAKEVFEEVFKHDIDPDKYVEEKGLKTVNDAGELQTVVEQVIRDNPQSVEDYRNGKRKSNRISGWTDNEGDERKGKSWNGQ